MATDQDPTGVLETTQPLTRDGAGFIIGALEVQLPEYNIAPVHGVHGHRPLQDRGNGYCTLIEVRRHGETKCYAFWIFSSDKGAGNLIQIMRAQ